MGNEQRKMNGKDRRSKEEKEKEEKEKVAHALPSPNLAERAPENRRDTHEQHVQGIRNVHNRPCRVEISSHFRGG